MKFESLEALSAEIARDVATATAHFDRLTL